MPAQATKRTTQRSRKHPYARTKKKTVCQSGGSKESSAASGVGGLFTVKFKPVNALVAEQKLGVQFSLEKIWDDIYPIYLKYCKKSKVSPNVALKAGKYVEAILALNNHFTAIIKKENIHAKVNIEFDKESNSFLFVVFAFYNFSQELISLPLEFLHSLKLKKSPLLQPMTALYKLIINKFGLLDWHDNPHFGFNIEMGLESAQEMSDDNPEEALQIINESAIYNGLAQEYLREVYNCTDKIEVDKIAGITRADKIFKDWIRNGVQLLKEKNVVNFQSLEWRVDSDTDEEDQDFNNDGDAVGMDRVLLVVWSNNDSAVERYIEGLNMDTSEFFCYDPMEFLFINAKAPIYKHNDWPDRAYRWLSQGLFMMSNYIPEKKKLSE